MRMAERSTRSSPAGKVGAFLYPDWERGSTTAGQRCRAMTMNEKNTDWTLLQPSGCRWKSSPHRVPCPDFDSGRNTGSASERWISPEMVLRMTFRVKTRPVRSNRVLSIVALIPCHPLSSGRLTRSSGVTGKKSATAMGSRCSTWSSEAIFSVRPAIMNATTSPPLRKMAVVSARSNICMRPCAS